MLCVGVGARYHRRRDHSERGKTTANYRQRAPKVATKRTEASQLHLLLDCRNLHAGEPGDKEANPSFRWLYDGLNSLVLNIKLRDSAPTLHRKFILSG